MPVPMLPTRPRMPPLAALAAVPRMVWTRFESILWSLSVRRGRAFFLVGFHAGVAEDDGIGGAEVSGDGERDFHHLDFGDRERGPDEERQENDSRHGENHQEPGVTQFARAIMEKSLVHVFIGVRREYGPIASPDFSRRRNES